MRASLQEPLSTRKAEIPSPSKSGGYGSGHENARMPDNRACLFESGVFKADWDIMPMRKNALTLLERGAPGRASGAVFIVKPKYFLISRDKECH